MSIHFLHLDVIVAVLIGFVAGRLWTRMRR